MQTHRILGIPISIADYDDIAAIVLSTTQRPLSIAAANTHLLTHTNIDPTFENAIKSFDYILPDSTPLFWIIKAAHPKQRSRVYGPKLMSFCLQRSQQTRSSLTHYFLGSDTRTLSDLQNTIRNQYPDVSIAGAHSPPFTQWTSDDRDHIIQNIIDAQPAIVWVSFGCPKQETWLAQHKHLLPPAVYITVGQAFKILSGIQKPAPEILQALGLEWFYRLTQEPKRLWKRYLQYNTLFLILFIKSILFPKRT